MCSSRFGLWVTRLRPDEFSAQLSLGPRAVGWLEVEIDRWIASRVERSREVNHTEQAVVRNSRASK
jgi:hypothetical protein